MLHATPDSSSQEHLSYFVFNQIALVFFSAAGGLPRSVSFQVFEGFALAVSNLEMHALFVLGDLRARLVKLFHSRFVYVTEQNAEGIYIAEIDTETALVVDDKPGLELKVGDHFRAAVLPSREGGKFEIKFRDIKMTVYGIGEYAYVSSPLGEGIVFKEGQTVMLIFAAKEQLTEGLSKTLKAVTAKAAK